MLQNPEAEAFFLPLSAHSDVTSELLTALRRLGEYEIRYAPRNFGAAYAVWCGCGEGNLLASAPERRERGASDWCGEGTIGR